MKTLVENLEVYEAVKRWMTRLEKKSRRADFSKTQTKRAALFWLKKYCNYLKTNPDELIHRRAVQVQDKDPTIKRQHEDFVESFVVNLKNDGYAPNSIATAQGLVSSFYKASHVGMEELDPVRAFNVRTFKVPQVKDLKKMCALADRDHDVALKAWCLCQANCGLAIDDLLSLKWNQLSSEFGTIRHQLEKGIMPIHIEIRRGKTGERTDSFFGPNAVEALKEYLAMNGGSMTGTLFNMSVRSIQAKVKSLAIRAKVATVAFPITPHKLRDFFNTYMKLAGVNEAIVERWMGHSIGKVRSAYLVMGKDDKAEGIPISVLAKTYLDAYDAIDITKV